MDIESFRNYCLSKKGVTEEFPFDNATLVFKVMGKMFALANIDEFVSVNLKCDPEKAILLREQFHEVLPGYHMNKKHWNTINLQGQIGDVQLQEWIDQSYDLVIHALPKKLKQELEKLS